MAPHSSALAWRIPWTGEPGRLQSMGSRRVGYDWATSLSLFTVMHWRRKRQPTPVFLSGESHGWRSLVGYSPQVRKESDTTEWFHFHFHVCVHSAIQSCPTLRPHGLVPWTYYVCSLIYINIHNKIYYLGRGYFCWKGEINTTVTISDLLIKNKNISHFLNEKKFVWC